MGQNFLVDGIVIQQIVACIAPSPQDHLVEIGPGLGAITVPLLPLVAKIDAIELDRDLIPLLQKNAASKGHLEIHPQNVLQFNLETLSVQPKSLRVVGNLPYNISSPLLFHLLEQKRLIADMHFMVQQEVAERLTAHPNTKQYGRLTVMAQYHCYIEPLLAVPPYAFRPAPKVHSTFIRLTPSERKIAAKNKPHFDHVVKQAFAQRRKTIHNSLKGLISKEQLIALDIDPMLRAENLTVEDFVVISNFSGRGIDYVEL
jgi:16S rRNA (adenine1518-N6/adenine1519-N6)-dimethyltransferase